MADLEFLFNVALRALSEENEPERWWYLSFASDAGFIGGMVVRANGVITARLRVAELGLNPGGEMLAMPVVDGVPLPDAHFHNRLLTKAEVCMAFAESGGACDIHGDIVEASNG